MKFSICAICDGVARFGFTQVVTFESRSKGNEGEVKLMSRKCFRQREGQMQKP